MMKRIIQLIPTSHDLYVQYDGNNNSEKRTIVGFALIEINGNPNNRQVVPLELSSKGISLSEDYEYIARKVQIVSKLES